MFYLLSIVTILYLTEKNDALWLALLMPLLILSKETILPFVLLPFFKQSMRSKSLALSLLLSLCLLFFTRHYISHFMVGDDSGSLSSTVLTHALKIGGNLRYFLSPGGVVDLTSGFSLFLVFGALGFFSQRRLALYAISRLSFAALPIALALALLSGNGGRMLFSAFPIVFAYTVIFIDGSLRRLCT